MNTLEINAANAELNNNDAKNLNSEIKNNETKPAGEVTFSDFAITDALKQRLANAKFVTPTPVQAGAIPPALEGKDVLATAATGTGKTLSFLIPMIHRMDTRPAKVEGKRNSIRALILLPTRELAMQVLDAYGKLMPQAKSDAVLVCGGMSEGAQLDAIRRGPRLVVATPGRLEDYLQRNEINLKNVEMLVLDEVDRMLDMGFLPAIRRIARVVPKDRQTMCYSATLDANISEVVRDYVTNPIRVQIGTTSKPNERVELRAVKVMQDQKTGMLEKMLTEEAGTYLVFCRTKHGTERLGRKLEKMGYSVACIHGDRSQSQRTAALKSFSTGKSRIMVATDVAARGIDVSNIAHVVNYDLPNATDDFVHRIGRTGRAGAHGVATTFVMPQEIADARKLEREIKVKFQWSEADSSIEKEERNKPVDLTQVNDLMQLETRSWKTNPQGDGIEPTETPYRKPQGSNRYGGGNRNGGGPNRNGGGNRSNNRRRRS